jgi:hypothetical protein
MIKKLLIACAALLALAGCVDADNTGRNPGNTGTGTSTTGAGATDTTTGTAATGADATGDTFGTGNDDGDTGSGATSY